MGLSSFWKKVCLAGLLLLNAPLAYSDNITAVLATAKAMYCEARGEGRSGMLVVADVIHNRLEHGCFGKTIEEIVYKPNAFECITNGYKPDMRSDEFIEVAKLAWEHFNNKTPRMTIATHYVKKDHPVWWRKKLAYLGTHKNHDLYLENRRC